MQPKGKEKRKRGTRSRETHAPPSHSQVGGAVALYTEYGDCDLAISDTVFEYNSAYATVLRRIFVPTSASLRDLSSSRTPLPQGGALDLSSGGILSVPSSTFRHNSAAYGGAVGVGTVYSAGRVQISGSSFHNHLVTAMVGKDSQLSPESAFSSNCFRFPVFAGWRGLRFIGEQSRHH